MKLNHHAALFAIGAHQYHPSSKDTEYWTIPESAEDKFYDMRDTIPFDNLLSGYRDGGFIVYLDKPKVSDTLAAAAPDLLAALEAFNAWRCDYGDGSPELEAVVCQALATIAKARGQ